VQVSGGCEREPDRRLHPSVGGYDEPRACRPADRDGYAARPVLPRREPVPTVEVDPDEYRLQEEGESLEGEGSPITDPNLPVRPGQKIPKEKDSTVPDTAPTANRTPKAFDQRLARSFQTLSWWRFASCSAMSIRTGKPTPIEAKTMWKARETAICVLAASRPEIAITWVSILLTRRSVIGRFDPRGVRPLAEEITPEGGVGGAALPPREQLHSCVR
jgi:hypothetical protein